MKNRLYEAIPVEEADLQFASIYTALIGGRIPMVVQYIPEEEGSNWKSIEMMGKIIPKGVTHILQPLLKSEGRNFYFKNKPYLLLCESKIKAEGIAEALEGYGVTQTDVISPEMDWIEVVIYMCLYENPDGQIWVREKNEFYSKFKTESDERENNT
jgi:hypothetical protein